MIVFSLEWRKIIPPLLVIPSNYVIAGKATILFVSFPPKNYYYSTKFSSSRLAELCEWVMNRLRRAFSFPRIFTTSQLREEIIIFFKTLDASNLLQDERRRHSWRVRFLIFQKIFNSVKKISQITETRCVFFSSWYEGNRNEEGYSFFLLELLLLRIRTIIIRLLVDVARNYFRIENWIISPWKKNSSNYLKHDKDNSLDYCSKIPHYYIFRIILTHI